MSDPWFIIFSISFIIGYILSIILADAYNYSVGFVSLFSFAFIGLFFSMLLYCLYLWVTDNLNKERKKRIDDFKNTFPHSYYKYIKIIEDKPLCEIAREINKHSKSGWKIIERDLVEDLKTKYEEIEENYPNGLRTWKKRCINPDFETVIDNKNLIIRLENYHKKSEEYNQWEKEQSEFTNRCREIGPSILYNFGYYRYQIPFSKFNELGAEEPGEFLIWQFFMREICFETDLDYTNFKTIKQNTENIEKYKNGQLNFDTHAYLKICNFINELAKTYNISVYLCTNNRDWSENDFLMYYSLLVFMSDKVGESVEIHEATIDNIFVASIEDELQNADKHLSPRDSFIHDYYPIVKNKHLVIIEAQTSNSHLKEVCEKILQKNRNLHPLISYISFLKGYDRDEMSELIEKKNKEIEEGKRSLLKKQEIENCINDLPRLIASNDVEKIEEQIRYINDNLNLVNTEKKDEFEKRRFDYSSKKQEGIPQEEKLLFVNYDIPQTNTEEGYYVIVRMPQKGCVVWPYRRRNIARRGYTELSFENALNHYLSHKVKVLGDVNILPQNGVRPYEPDIALIYSGNGLNIRIDIEIDEPYAAITNKPTHYIGCGDEYRDANLNMLGWIVIRFSERQIFENEIGCVRFIAEIIKSVDSSFIISTLENIPDLNFEKQWTKVESQKMAKEKMRQRYLNHDFGITDEPVYSVKDIKLTPFETSLLDRVKPTFVPKPAFKKVVDNNDFENDKIIRYNKTNRCEQDDHIKFDANLHVYTVDGIQYQSVSSVISDLFPEFDSEYWSTVKGQQRNVSPQLVLEEWDSKGQQSREVGTFLHQQIENYFLNKSIKTTYHYIYHGTYLNEDCMIDIGQEFSYFMNFISKTEINPYRSEWRIFDKSLKIAGTIDLISKNKNGSYDIYDWKRSSRLHQSNPYQHGYGRLSALEDTPRNHYYLQQNLYRFILEHQYGLKVHSMKLVVLHPLYDEYYIVDVPLMNDEVQSIIQML